MTHTHTPGPPDMADRIADVVRTLITAIRPELVKAAVTGQRGESANTRHADNFLSVHDLWMHEQYRTLLAQHIPSFVYASEEDDPRVIGPDPDPDLCILVDPLDTSELAVRALCGYTHVLAYSRSLARPVVAVVGDIFHHIQLYTAVHTADGNDHAYLTTADGSRHPLRPSGTTDLSTALVTNYLMRPTERFTPLAAQTRLLHTLTRPTAAGHTGGRIGVDFGSIGLCHVAAGQTDAMIEFAKGFAIWDLAPGHYILHAAGGTVLDLNANPLDLTHPMDTLADIATAMKPRQTFIAAATPALADQLAHLITH